MLLSFHTSDYDLFCWTYRYKVLDMFSQCINSRCQRTWFIPQDDWCQIHFLDIIIKDSGFCIQITLNKQTKPLQTVTFQALTVCILVRLEN